MSFLLFLFALNIILTSHAFISFLVLIVSLSWFCFQVDYAFTYWKIFFGSILFNNEKASCLLKFWMISNFEMIKVFLFFLKFIMKFYDLLNKICIFLIQNLSILHVIQDGSWFRFDFIDIHVENSSNSIRLFLFFCPLLTSLLQIFVTLFFCQPEFRSYAVVEMTTLLLPEIFEILIFNLTESKLFSTNQLIL